MYKQDDTIAAVATAPGAGGVGIIRLSGPEALSILTRLLGVRKESVEPRFLHHGHARDEGGVIDEVLYVLMAAPRSFTGEDVAEIHGHGGALNMGRLLRAVLALGARHAEAGEFTRRAFVNGRLDLVRAEAIADIVSAGSERALLNAQRQLQGSLGTRLDGLRSNLTVVLAEVEAGIDFPDEELPTALREELLEKLRDALRHCRELIESFRYGQALREGVDVVLRGPVNAGKSSLFNQLLGRERSIVDAEGGTTRDFIEGSVVWDGVTVHLVDTAGEREEAISSVEERGIHLGRDRAKLSDIELVLVPPGEPLPTRQDGQILLASKSDLAGGMKGAIPVSALSGEGLDAVKAAILEEALQGQREVGDGLVITSERQHARLLAAAKSMEAAVGLLESRSPGELTAVELNEAMTRLGEVLGEEIGDAVLDELFARFCIGK